MESFRNSIDEAPMGVAALTTGVATAAGKATRHLTQNKSLLSQLRSMPEDGTFIEIDPGDILLGPITALGGSAQGDKASNPDDKGWNRIESITLAMHQYLRGYGWQAIVSSGPDFKSMEERVKAKPKLTMGFMQLAGSTFTPPTVKQGGHPLIPIRGFQPAEGQPADQYGYANKMVFMVDYLDGGLRRVKLNPKKLADLLEVVLTKASLV